MLIALTSWKGSPGVTTSALALASVWPAQRHVVVAECDPLGGEVLAGYGQGAAAEGRGVLEMVLSARGSGRSLEASMWEHVLALDSTRNRWLLPGVGRPQESAAVPWDRVAEALWSREDVDVLADCGRLRAQGAPAAVLRAADLTVLLLGASTTAVYAVHRSEQVLRTELGVTGRVGDGVVAVVVGPGHGNHDTSEIARHLDPLGIPVVGELAHDPGSAAVLSSGAPARRGFASSRLLRSAADLVEVLGQRAAERRARIAPPPSPQPAAPRAATVSDTEIGREVAW